MLWPTQADVPPGDGEGEQSDEEEDMEKALEKELQTIKKPEKSARRLRECLGLPRAHELTHPESIFIDTKCRKFRSHKPTIT